MDFCRLTESLDDERCGLFFLAGLDGEDAAEGAVLTVHAAEGTLTPEQRGFIEAVAAAADTRLGVRFRYHAPGDLHAPDTLERFAGLFRHSRIVADPTGAFSRVSKLLQLARAIRAQFGRAVGPILWQTHASRLVVVAAPVGGNTAACGVSEEAVRALVDRVDCADLKKTIKSVTVGTAAPGTRYTPIDAVMPASAQPRPGIAGLVARVSGIAALIGLGTLAGAQAKAPVQAGEEPAMMPGITALADLTTLGENAYGARNHYQAIGGLRLYFGETGTVRASVFNPSAIGAVAPPEADEREPGKSQPLMPSVIAYGG